MSSDRLRALIAEPGVVHAPGCYDAVTAKLVEREGFQVAYLSGAATSAVVLGEPDLGYIGMRDMAAHGARISAALSIPLIADADTGYGNALHVEMTTRAYIAAGIAGFHLEDQRMPKRCGHMSGKALIGVEEAAQKVRAAVETSAGRAVVIARTDAFSVEGLAGALDRAGAYHAAGADLVFVEGVVDRADLNDVHRAIPDAKLVFNRSEAAARAEELSDEDLAEVGARLIIHPVSAVLAAAKAVADVYASIRTTGRAHDPRMPWSTFTDVLGLPEALEREQRHTTGA